MTFDAPAALAVSARIADHLCETAWRHGGRCTWMGMTQDADDGDDEVEFTYGSLGPELYGGTSGVALFLAEAHRRTGDPRWRETALAAIRHALDGAAAIAPAARPGFYAGQVGIAYAAVMVADAVRDAEVHARGIALLDALHGAASGDLVVDHIAGGSGAIAPLLLLAQQLDRPALIELAMRWGQQAIEAATRSDDGWTWPTNRGAIDAARPLTGLAHGAAGIGWSLLELGHAARAPAMIEGAHQAFRYENRWFRPREDNWPDFREEDGDDAPACASWCHGAPGIGLVRLRAVELGSTQYLADASAAIRTTRSALADRDRWIDGDFTLCHGRAGLAEVLRDAVRVLGDAEAEALVWDAAAAGATRFGDAPESWPCGVRRGSNPSLMIGLAGIGHFYLGLADPSLRSVLLVRPAAPAP